jgi:hypothetical protein
MMQPKPKKSTAPKKPVQKKKSNSPVDMYKNMVDPATGKKGTMGGEGTRPPFEKGDLPVKSATLPKRTYVGGKPAKNGKTMMKAKNGKSFPDLNKDGKITKADILKGRGVIAKKGASIKKAQDGVKTIGPNKYAKEQVINKDKKKAYVATNTGTVHSIDNKRMQTIDTTGYSKGKPTYELKEKGKSKTINRKDVKPLLKNMKKNASMKTGGKMTKCKYGCK